jgi:hypothetical protein
MNLACALLGVMCAASALTPPKDRFQAFEMATPEQVQAARSQSAPAYSADGSALCTAIQDNGSLFLRVPCDFKHAGCWGNQIDHDGGCAQGPYPLSHIVGYRVSMCSMERDGWDCKIRSGPFAGLR